MEGIYEIGWKKWEHYMISKRVGYPKKQNRVKDVGNVIDPGKPRIKIESCTHNKGT